MAGLGIMLPIAIFLAVFFLVLFFWSLKNGDVEDAAMSRHRMIFDDEDDVDHSFDHEKTKAESTAPQKT